MDKVQTAFKETEIGPIPEDWVFTPLQNHAEILMGQSPESDYYNNAGEGVPFLQGIRTFGDKYPTYDAWTTQTTKLAKSGSVLLSVRAPVGEVNIATQDICIGRGLVAINGEDNEYIYQIFKAFKKYVIGKETGTVYGSVTSNDIARLHFPFPPLPEQRRIAEVLSSLDDKIELNRKMNKTLESIAQAIFKRWFIDFEFPNEKGKPYKSSGGRMVESELGLIPEGWEIMPLDEVADITIGRTPPRKEDEWFSTDPKDIKWISIRDMGNAGVYIDDTAEYLTAEAVRRFNVPKIPTNTVIVSFKLTVGRVAITTEEMLSNEAIAHIKLTTTDISSEYVYLFAKNYDFSALGSTSSIATAVNSQSIKGIKMLVPKASVAKEFHERIEPVFSDILSG